MGGALPPYKPGARCYVVAWGRLRGYAPMVPRPRAGHQAIVRGGGAVACTTPDAWSGFQGFRYRHWRREEEVPFPGWAIEGLPTRLRRDVEQLLELRARGPAVRAELRRRALAGLPLFGALPHPRSSILLGTGRDPSAALGFGAGSALAGTARGRPL
jgi:hypothetical protein